jgi:2-polyprenyl-6-hydroxyphenyl methylase/3-demethylubiquinone-9 3-methyltransferase
VAAGERFEFGKNWARFLEGLTEERIARAEASLVRMLDRTHFPGAASSTSAPAVDYSAWRPPSGARVCSVDFDPQSVACAWSCDAVIFAWRRLTGESKRVPRSIRII